MIVANADGSDLRKLATRKRPAEFPLFGVAWSPDAKTIVATGAQDGQLRGEIVAVDAATGAERVLPSPDWRQVNRVAWLPDGSASSSTRRSPPPNLQARCFT